MATWQKSSDALVQLFDASLPLTKGVERRKMFSYPCAFVNGNMFAGLHEQRLAVRLPSEAAASPFVVMGRVMREYHVVADPLEQPPEKIRDWIARALAYTRALPAKPAKPAKVPRAAPVVKAAVAAKPSKPARVSAD